MAVYSSNPKLVRKILRSSELFVNLFTNNKKLYNLSLRPISYKSKSINPVWFILITYDK
jgi:hypothetical protein